MTPFPIWYLLAEEILSPIPGLHCVLTFLSLVRVLSWITENRSNNCAPPPPPFSLLFFWYKKGVMRSRGNYNWPLSNMDLNCADPRMWGYLSVVNTMELHCLLLVLSRTWRKHRYRGLAINYMKINAPMFKGQCI